MFLVKTWGGGGGGGRYPKGLTQVDDKTELSLSVWISGRFPATRISSYWADCITASPKKGSSKACDDLQLS